MDRKLHVSIPSWEFEDRHIVFNISTIPVEGETYSTKRRYREFERLNRKLEGKLLPRINLPGKLIMHTDSAIEGRRVKLEKAFKNYVQMNSGVLDPLVEDFLLPRDENLHSSRKSSMQESVMDDSMMIAKEEEKKELLSPTTPIASSEENSEMENDSHQQQVHHHQQYQTWSLEMLVARAGLRAERRLSLRLARIYTFATVATLIGSFSSKTHRWPLIGAAFGSAVSAGFALLSALWSAKKEDWRRRGFGLQHSPLQSTDSSDVSTLVEYLEEKRKRSTTEDSTNTNQGTTSAAATMTFQTEPTTKTTPPKHQKSGNGIAPPSTTVIDETILDKLDNLHSVGNHDEVIMIVKSFKKDDSRIAWRWARAVYYRSMFYPEGSAERLEEVLLNLKQSATLEQSALTHKWLAIIHNAYGEKKGSIKERVEAGLAFEYHTKKALEIDPQDATLHYMSGRFCFDVSGLSWFERQGAKAISGKEPPKATYADALKHYENAMALKPSSAFELEIGRCHLRMKNDKKALEYFKMAADFVSDASGTPLTMEEESAIEEAKDFVRKMTS